MLFTSKSRKGARESHPMPPVDINSPESSAGTCRVLYNTCALSEKPGVHTQAPAAATENHRVMGGGFREADSSEPFELLAGWH